MKERYEKRLFRIFEEAGYSPIRILTITPEEYDRMMAHDYQNMPDLR